MRATIANFRNIPNSFEDICSLFLKKRSFIRLSWSPRPEKSKFIGHIVVFFNICAATFASQSIPETDEQALKIFPLSETATQQRHIEDAQEEARPPIAALSRSLSPSSSSDASSYSSFSSTSSEEEPIGGAIEKTGQFRTIAALRGEIDPIPREMEQQVNHTRIFLLTSGDLSPVPHNIQCSLSQLEEILRFGIIREKEIFSFFEKNYAKNYSELTPGSDNLIIQAHKESKNNNIKSMKEILRDITPLKYQKSFTNALYNLFHTLLQGQLVGLRRYFEQFTDRSNIYRGISTHPVDMAKQTSFKRFVAQTIIDRYALRGLVMRDLYDMIEDATSLPENTKQLLSCCSIIRKYITGETRELPPPALCIQDVKAFKTEYLQFFLLNQMSKLTSQAVQVIPITGKAKKALKRKEKKERAQEKREIRKSMREENQEEIHEQLLAIQLARPTTRKDKESLERLTRLATWNISPPIPSMPPRPILQAPRKKEKTRGFADVSRSSSSLDDELSVEQEPASIILNEETSQFFRHDESGKSIKTYENFIRLFKNFPGQIDESTGSSHCKLYCIDTRNNKVMHVGSIWKYHGEIDRFGPDSIKHLLAYVERSGRTPWRPTNDSDAFYLIEFLPNLIKNHTQLIFDYYNPGFISLSAIGNEIFLYPEEIPDA